MASFSTWLYRRRGSLMRLIITLPILWFALVGMTVVFSGTFGGGAGGGGGGGLAGDADAALYRGAQADGRVGRSLGANSDDKDGAGGGAAAEGPKSAARQPGPPPPAAVVLDRPDPDRLRFEAQMQADMGRELRMKGRRRHNHPDMPDELPEHIMHQVPLPGNHGDEHGGAAAGKSSSTTSNHHDPNGPGELGKAVIIDKDKLSPEERKKYDDGFQNNAFNQYASDLMSLHRSLPDVRDEECRSLTYPKSLPDTSVVVIFHNEALTILQRTVFSVLDRSPAEYLKEIILVDDCSDFDHLKKPLEDFVASQPKVRLLRSPIREGLIRARLRGAAVARGAVVTFLDSHCEATQGWLEPLLARISENKSNVVTPIIDVINDDNLQYQYSNAKSTSVGGFDWNLQFNWHAIPEHERNRRKSDVDPIRSPTMAGGLFAISKEYFEYLGTYDPGMDIWGGENLEMSFRIWMCGGTLEIIPCSHVGHIFRKRSPYSWKTGVNVVKKNSIRVAEVWMDEHKSYYYERFNNDLGDYGDVTARKELRKKLNCKSFNWYLHNIYPEQFVPGEALASGEIRAEAVLSGQSWCLDAPADKNALQKHEAVKMWPCHRMGGNQYWMLSKNGEMRRDEGCMDYSGQNVVVYPCHGMKGNQEWLYMLDGTIRQKHSNLCMEISSDGRSLEMKQCHSGERQRWVWKRKEKKPESEVD